jgi:hypothetical protein
VIDERQQLLSRLAEDYKILQDKIDKIGGFRFTIKGWSLTLIVAAILSGAANKVSPRYLIPTVMVLFTWVFFWIEKTQTDLSAAFGQRAREIETIVTNMLQVDDNGHRIDELRGGRHALGIAHHLSDTRRSLFVRISEKVTRTVEQMGGPDARTILRSPTYQWIRSWWDADWWFYFVQTLSILVVAYAIGLGSAHDGPNGSDGQQIHINVQNATETPAGAKATAPAAVRNESRRDTHGQANKK